MAHGARRRDRSRLQHHRQPEQDLPRLRRRIPAPSPLAALATRRDTRHTTQWTIQLVQYHLDFPKKNITLLNRSAV